MARDVARNQTDSEPTEPVPAGRVMSGTNEAIEQSNGKDFACPEGKPSEKIGLHGGNEPILREKERQRRKGVAGLHGNARRSEERHGHGRHAL